MKKHSFIANERRRDLLILAGLAAVMLIIGIGVRNSYYLSLLTYASIYSIAALGLFLLFGYAGQISLAQAAFFGMGAYITAFSTLNLGLAPIIGIVAAIILPGLVGWLVSLQLLKLATNYLAMATLAFGTISFIAFSQLHAVTGGLDPGVIGVPPFDLLGISFRGPGPTFSLVAIFLVLTLLVTINLIHSRIGRALRALRTSEVAAAGLGIDVVRYKVIVFALAASMAGLAGALFAHLQTNFNASSFGVGLSIELLLMVVLGSVFTPWGALFGAAFVTLLPAALEDFDHYKLLIYGGIMTFSMIFVPDGLGKAAIDSLGDALGRLGRK